MVARVDLNLGQVLKDECNVPAVTTHNPAALQRASNVSVAVAVLHFFKCRCRVEEERFRRRVFVKNGQRASKANKKNIADFFSSRALVAHG